MFLYSCAFFSKNLSFHSYRDDDVRSSLDLLDEVIGEFDDGLTSAAESDILLGQSVTTPVTKRSHRYRYDQRSERQQDRISSRINGSNGLNKNENLKERDTHLVEEPIKANVRNLRPPVTTQKKQRDQSAPPYLNASRTKQNVASSDPRSQVLNHQIDDIFSELTNEIYVDDKRDRKSAQRTNDNNLNFEQYHFKFKVCVVHSAHANRVEQIDLFVSFERSLEAVYFARSP